MLYLFHNRERKETRMEKSVNRQTVNQNKYNKTNTTLVPLRFNHRTDADILEWLGGCSERGESKLGYFKRLVREDMERVKTGK